MKNNAWEVAGGGHEYRLSRVYSTANGTVEILCTVKSSPEVNFVVSDLSFRFKPLRTPRGSLVIGLFTDDPKGALVEVQAIPVPEEHRSRMLDVVMHVHREDTPKLLRALTSGNDVNFLIAKAASASERPFLTVPIAPLVHLMLSNDRMFKSVYEEAVEKVLWCQDATRTRQLNEGWYRRRTPGLDA
jgi:hypothetical protein